ncbi:MAG TPA: hypothetical protein VJK29_04590, partial [Terriglobales bacterium]|nr:hypothetical protein [Terriglobales bacterium]
MRILNRPSTSLFNVLPALSLVILASGLSAQVAEDQLRFGVPQDWTHRHIVFNRRVLSEHPELATIEPRVLHQFVREMRPSSLPGTSVIAEPSNRAMDSALKRDWNISLAGGLVAFGMSPAKYGFNPAVAPSCANDYLVFGLNVAGVTGGQGNLVAFNNLYRGTGGLCGTGAPTVLFSYNTTTVAGGKIATSPVLSVDGKKIAFVESAAGSAVFHVLTWATGAGNGTGAGASASPGVGNTASMTSLTYAPSATNSYSAPWIDYGSDVAYLGADDGKLYKITGVFKGTPTLAGAPWPVPITVNRKLSPAVLDLVTNNVFVGDNLGVLWSVNTISPLAPGGVHSLSVGLGFAIKDGPLVDSSNGTVFAVSPSDGTSAVLVQARASDLSQLARARIGMGSSGSPATRMDIYDGAFSDNYFNLPSSGFIFVCGTGAADLTPRRYTFGFNTATPPIMKTTASSSAQILNSTTSRCSPISEFFNPNITTGGPTGTDFFFWSMTADCTGPGTDGCVMSKVANLAPITTVGEVGGTSAITTDNFSTAGQASS